MEEDPCIERRRGSFIEAEPAGACSQKLAYVAVYHGRQPDLAPTAAEVLGPEDLNVKLSFVDGESSRHFCKL
jgi:hypothetical protein